MVKISVQLSSVTQLQLFATPWTAARRASLSITNAQSLLKVMSIESVMQSNHHHPLLSPSPPTFNLSQHQGLFKIGKGVCQGCIVTLYCHSAYLTYMQNTS